MISKSNSNSRKESSTVIGIVRRIRVDAEGEKRIGKIGINRVEKGRGGKN
jgi:hypothetical protein